MVGRYYGGQHFVPRLITVTMEREIMTKLLMAFVSKDLVTMIKLDLQIVSVI
jgi:hypothetical protein